MIFVKSISEIGDYALYDEVWMIVRSMKYPNPNMKQIPELSPSWDLFNKYRDLKEKGNWNKDTFNSIYLPQFLHEMHDANAINYLNTLYKLDKAGRNIVIACFCPDETLCHRSIVAGLLQGVGCNVAAKNDYSQYYNLYKSDEILNYKPEKQQPAAFRGENYFLSNMYPAPINLWVNNNRFTFTCSEAAFQAFKEPARMQEFVGLNGYDAKRLSHEVNLRTDWHDIRLDIMETVVRAKFTQHPELMQKLKAVKGEIAENNTWNDTFWGVYNGKGENHLGKILMKIRDE